MSGCVGVVLGAAGFLGVAATPDQAEAGWFSRSVPGQSTSMVEGAHRAAPKAYYRMCDRQPALCNMDRHAPGVTAEVMTKQRWRTVIDLNEQVNDQIIERNDLHVFGVSDYWTVGHRYGDCEDYTITKKQALIAQGFAPENLLYGVSRNTWDRGYHAVLILRTTDGDYVLDNLRDRILPWEDTGLDFVMRQAAGEAMAWVAVADRGAPPEQMLSMLAQ
ncbi:MAG: transglutaminase-like cysteine peptidase [Pseudomonadota bacterium]